MSVYTLGIHWDVEWIVVGQLCVTCFFQETRSKKVDSGWKGVKKLGSKSSFKSLWEAKDISIGAGQEYGKFEKYQN